ncbi:MAG: AAA family ATPase [Rhodospirillaceae bacterium]|jgi:chromosome partitioning protein|nr:AAA family ATPase [Rhodospirillaceae bacterium]MBT6404687.1 AAA family ATPase [Rhodospirillaceae bacterium]MBT6535564.1 AAA family ATPase [Rhodospirillaceae bacterium]MBT7361621.1 AAA family ATPase [Rhodospirillaceae bacterium]
MTIEETDLQTPRAENPAGVDATVIVLGNEKGGTGKSTTAMHIIVGLLREGYAVGAIDLDARQGTLARYFDNRRIYAAKMRLQLPHPTYRAIGLSDLRDGYAAKKNDRLRLADTLKELSATCDVIVLDTPGSDNPLSRNAHSYADILVTPMNDSFVDLDLLGRVDHETNEVLQLSAYSEMVWEQKKVRAQRDGGSIDWIVMRNRLATLDSKNKRNMDAALEGLSRRLGFRLAHGFSERVIFRELFLKGLTLLDVREEGADVTLTMSHMAALQEVRYLLQTIGVPEAAEAPEVASTR